MKRQTSIAGRSSRLFGVLALLWAGLVLGISFLEAPVKFTAPSLTLPVGLDVGRHVFRALNRVELLLWLVSLVLLWTARPRRHVWLGLGIAWSALFLQTVWLLPALDARAVLIIAGVQPPSSTGLHLIYGLADAAKVLALIAAGWFAFQRDPAPQWAPAACSDMSKRRATHSVTEPLQAASASSIIPYHETSSSRS